MFESLQARMRQIKRNRDGGRPGGREPFVAQIAGRPKRQAARAQFFVELRDAAFELAAGNAHAEIADAPVEKLVVFRGYPGQGHGGGLFWRAGRRIVSLHGFHPSAEGALGREPSS